MSGFGDELAPGQNGRASRSGASLSPDIGSDARPDDPERRARALALNAEHRQLVAEAARICTGRIGFLERRRLAAIERRREAVMAEVNALAAELAFAGAHDIHHHEHAEERRLLAEVAQISASHGGRAERRRVGGIVRRVTELAAADEALADKLEDQTTAAEGA